MSVNPMRQTGTHAEYVACNPEELCAAPRTLAALQAASLPYAGMTALCAMQQVKLLPAAPPLPHDNKKSNNKGVKSKGELRNKTVFVHGASGGLGTFAVELLRWYGATVLCTSGAAGVERLTRLGCAAVVNYRDESAMAQLFAEHFASVDVVLDASGFHEHSARDELACIDLLKPNATPASQYVTMTGQWLAMSTEHVSGAADAAAMLAKKKMLHEQDSGIGYHWCLNQPDHDALTQIARLADAGIVSARVDDSASFELADTAAAHAYFEQRDSAAREAGKVCITIN
jgi:NADPH:quinone reductase-like Zn-dependent oxidoreductase